MKKNLIEVRCCLVMHDVCDFPLLSKCLCSMILSVLKVLLCFFFFLFCWQESTQIMKYHWMFWKRNVWKLIVVKNDLIERKLPMLTVSFFFFAFKTKIFVYTCSNRPNEVSIEFLWLYVITVDIYICEICLLFLLTSCFSLWRVCECHIILLYLKNTASY